MSKRTGYARDRREAWGCIPDIRKGVISSIWEDEHMPRNENGDVADIIMASKSTIDRSNWGRNLYPYFANAARVVTKELRKRSGLNERAIEEQVEMLDDNVFKDCFSYLLGFYAIVSPFSFWNYTSNVKDPLVLRKHLHACITEGVKCLMPVDNPINEIDAILQLEKHYPQPYQPVTYKGEGCDFVTTKGPVRIAPLYMWSLEKIADDGSTTNLGKLQHHGLLASQTRSEKYSQPYRSNPTRNCGEAEGRLYLFYAKTPRAVAEMLDRSNNPATMRSIAKTFLTHETPTNITELVDRSVIKYNPRPLQFLRHFMVTQGADIAYMPEEEAFDLGMKEIFHAR